MQALDGTWVEIVFLSCCKERNWIAGKAAACEGSQTSGCLVRANPPFSKAHWAHLHCFLPAQRACREMHWIQSLGAECQKNYPEKGNLIKMVLRIFFSPTAEASHLWQGADFFFLCHVSQLSLWPQRAFMRQFFLRRAHTHKTHGTRFTSTHF